MEERHSRQYREHGRIARRPSKQHYRSAKGQYGNKVASQEGQAKCHARARTRARTHARPRRHTTDLAGIVDLQECAARGDVREGPGRVRGGADQELAGRVEGNGLHVLGVLVVHRQRGGRLAGGPDANSAIGAGRHGNVLGRVQDDVIDALGVALVRGHHLLGLAVKQYRLLVDTAREHKVLVQRVQRQAREPRRARAVQTCSRKVKREVSQSVRAGHGGAPHSGASLTTAAERPKRHRSPAHRRRRHTSEISRLLERLHLLAGAQILGLCPLLALGGQAACFESRPSKSAVAIRISIAAAMRLKRELSCKRRHDLRAEGPGHTLVLWRSSCRERQAGCL